uniref:Uncharacterized protein n=1 Tax=Cyanothece sp. (strain PCC 7425 / ATCC 29141) TaxID=395961 RepID=B8HQR7_CYAP4
MRLDEGCAWTEYPEEHQSRNFQPGRAPLHCALRRLNIELLILTEEPRNHYGSGIDSGLVMELSDFCHLRFISDL